MCVQGTQWCSPLIACQWHPCERFRLRQVYASNPNDFPVTPHRHLLREFQSALTGIILEDSRYLRRRLFSESQRYLCNFLGNYISTLLCSFLHAASGLWHFSALLWHPMCQTTHFPTRPEFLSACVSFLGSWYSSAPEVVGAPILAILVFFLYFIIIFFTFLYFHMGEGREKEKEENIGAWEKQPSVTPCTPHVP